MEYSANLLRLNICKLAAQRGEKILFADLSFCLQSGQFVQISGANGVGKSTLLRCIAGLCAPLSGSIALSAAARPPAAGSAAASAIKTAQNGENNSADNSGKLLPIKLFSHYLGDKNAMKAELSVWENLRFWHRFFADMQGIKTGKAEETAILAAALSHWRMTAQAHLPFAALSSGQKRRIGLSRLLLSPRPLWLLDEPSNGLDQAGNMLFAAICRRHLRRGGAIVTATHMPHDIPVNACIALGDYHPKQPEKQFYHPFCADYAAAQTTTAEEKQTL